ncbi:hypothetical protein POM88_051339 [Heracleum sosnowskyi]|uniref:BED-type domain-containing protein n=1 Tax=Heracleum sosnowskyi TaxID=360622 RepID=A0AAD8M3M3_9APIA|nr:hypothetical protein POM88_051339 [Heracleum sosnowskyi]
MDEEQPGSNNPQYESLSDDEADLRENETDTATGPPTAGSVKPEKEGKGIKRKWSKAWDTFDHIKGTPEEGDTAKCKKCSYTIAYNSSFGTGNMLKHQKICVSSADIRQMIISKSQGTMMVHHGAFDPKVFRDMITDAVVTGHEASVGKLGPVVDESGHFYCSTSLFSDGGSSTVSVIQITSEASNRPVIIARSSFRSLVGSNGFEENGLCNSLKSYNSRNPSTLR